MKIVLQISFSIIKVQLYWIENYCNSVKRLGLRDKNSKQLIHVFSFFGNSK